MMRKLVGEAEVALARAPSLAKTASHKERTRAAQIQIRGVVADVSNGRLASSWPGDRPGAIAIACCNAPCGRLPRGMRMRGSKVFKPTDLPESNSSWYPAPFRDGQGKRWNRRLGD